MNLDVSLLWIIVVPIVCFLFLVAIGALIVAWLRNPVSLPKGPSSAMRLLEERFARGEIDREEFLERREVLSEERRRSPR